MAGILEEFENMTSFDDISTIGDPATESEVVLNALYGACESDEEFTDLLESAGAEMALYGVISDADIAQEVVKKIVVDDWKAANFNRICRRTAIRLAMINNDPLYTKYRKYRDLLISVRDQIYKKYMNKAKIETKKIIKNARNKASNMNSDAGKSITDKMDKQIAVAEGAEKKKAPVNGNNKKMTVKK